MYYLNKATLVNLWKVKGSHALTQEWGVLHPHTEHVEQLFISHAARYDDTVKHVGILQMIF